MKLLEFMNYINAALNFPAISIEDVLVYCDMAMSELNTTLHTNIPLISDQITKYLEEQSKDTKYIVLSEDPTTEAIYTREVGKPIPTGIKAYYDPSVKHFFILDVATNTYVQCDNFKGVYFRDHIKEFWAPMLIGNSAFWKESEYAYSDNYNLNKHLPNDWIMLWLIPYVCFKYTVRDGGTAQTFAEELTQGFQQLQDTYDVPSKIILATVANEEAYKDLVLQNLPNLNIYVRVVAIYENMKHDRGILPIFGSMYDRGGF